MLCTLLTPRDDYGVTFATVSSSNERERRANRSRSSKIFPQLPPSLLTLQLLNSSACYLTIFWSYVVLPLSFCYPFSSAMELRISSSNLRKKKLSATFQAKLLGLESSNTAMVTAIWAVTRYATNQDAFVYLCIPFHLKQESSAATVVVLLIDKRQRAEQYTSMIVSAPQKKQRETLIFLHSFLLSAAEKHHSAHRAYLVQL